MRSHVWLSLGMAMVATGLASAQQACDANGVRITGQVLDVTGAVVVGATVTVDEARTLESDRTGSFATACLATGNHRVHVEAPGFDAVDVTAGDAPLHIRLKPAVAITVEATSEGSGVDATDFAGSKTLGQAEIKGLADDPDEFARQLQVLAVTAGGAPGSAIITVDGFQGSGRIPPKSAISFIRVNPDLFSAEYARPPYMGGRIEIYTKPGQGSFHGALFTTQSAAWMNAKDPFSLSKAPLGRQRYGFELSGPIRKNRADFALNLEHRQINQFAVVNAITLNSAAQTVNVVSNVPTTQSLWEGSARTGIALSPKNNLTATYTATVNGLQNVGVGGTALQETGYASQQSEHAIRLTNLQTISPTVIHESRLGYTWRRRDDTPNSTAPAVAVAGAFSGGGVVTGAMQTHEGDLEFDDDIMWQKGKHSFKAGIELMDMNYNEQLPTGFNGSYTFGGCAVDAGGNCLTNSSGAGSVGTINGFEQYRRALLGLPGGTPTQFSVTVGTPAISLNQFQNAVFVQDQWKYSNRLQISLGLRWAMQNAPTTVGNVGPRIGVTWSPDRAQKWVFHVRTGLFYNPVDAQIVTLEAMRLNGTNQRQVLISNPVYGNALNTGTATVSTQRTGVPQIQQGHSLQSHFGVEHDFPHHYHAQANVYVANAWNTLRTANINQPTDGSPTGPRPITPNVNLLQFQPSGHLHGTVLFVGLDQHSLRRVQVFAGYLRMDLRTNADSETSQPQNSRSDAGETARLSGMATHRGILFSNITLPKAVSLSTQFDIESGAPYNITTGLDNNGDGVFNDRPVRPIAGQGYTTLYSTRYGTLSPTGAGIPLNRNAGTLPWTVHLDLNLSRSFALTHPKNGEAQTLGVNLRSTNLLNHNNVTAVGTVLGSPLFGQAYAAEAGRRVEAGLRWNF